MKLSFGIREMIKEKSGCELRLSSDCEKIALDITIKTSEHLGVNTLKRLLGFINDERTPRASTLDILARYLDFPDWETLSRVDDRSNSSFDTIDGELRVSDLNTGTIVEIEYFPDRVVTMNYIGNRIFKVTDSINSKIKKDDFVEIHHIVQGFPLLVVNVVRNDVSCGSFSAGKVSGVTSIKIQK